MLANTSVEIFGENAGMRELNLKLIKREIIR